MDEIPEIPSATVGTHSAAGPETQPTNKADIFDTSKEKIVPDHAFSTENMTEAQICEKFQELYDKDPELRKVLAKSNVATFHVEEKQQIIEAYMQSGGASQLHIEMCDDSQDEASLSSQAARKLLEGSGDDAEIMTQEQVEMMSKQDKDLLEREFKYLWTNDPVLHQLLGKDPSSLSLWQKYQVMVELHRASENKQNQSGVDEDSEEQ